MKPISAIPSTTGKQIFPLRTSGGYASPKVNGCGCEKHAGADYQRAGFPAGTGADSKPPQEVQGMVQRRFFPDWVKCADCGWSLSLWGEQARTASLTAIIIVASTGRAHANAPCTISVMMCFMPMSSPRLQYWSGLVQHDEERLLKRAVKCPHPDKGQAAARKKQAAELKKAEKRKAEVDTLFARMYEDTGRRGRITEYNFSMLSGKYQSEQAELDEKI